ncbi:hypothetical protein LCGC14_0537240 [marine sediment metagenome]|uniref:Uncharacterized protein n=1 Tax=marine sediment metagenome TaxID=412755 RepID=A0A0F9RYJ1_9ZZZZ
MWIKTDFQNGAVAAIGISPIIRIRNVETGSVVASGVMAELADGFYAYDFVGYDITKEYVILCDAVTLLDLDRYKSLATGQYGDMIDTIGLVSDNIDFRAELVKKIWQNKLELSDGNTGNLVIYDDDNTTSLISWDVTDVVDTSIEQGIYNTSKRSRGT